MRRQQIRVNILAFAAASMLTACATTAPSHPAAAAPPSSSAPAATTAALPKGMKATYGNYVQVVRNGQILYCMQERDTGTRMMQETCLTQAQMEAQQKNARSFMQDAQGMANAPVTGPNVH